MLNEYFIKHYDEIDSTHSESTRLLAEGMLRHGCVVIAESQLGGFGRYGRAWESPAGNIYLTIAIKPNLQLVDWPKVSYVAGVAIYDAIMQVDQSISAYFKWVNDIIIDDKKCGGILLTNLKDEFLLIGIGLNVIYHQGLEKLNATSLDRCISGGSAGLKDKMISILLEKFKLHYNALESGDFIPIKNMWMKRAYNRGKRVVVKFHNKSEEGVFLGIDEDGRMQLLQDGTVNLIDAGELFFI
jgi:BirA family biotin operon repressor/biotin-[acetyl-CoA-carboxylase] ligase